LVDETHCAAAGVKREGRFMLGRMRSGFSEAGWEGVPDDPPPWHSTVVATWQPARLPKLEVSIALIVLFLAWVPTMASLALGSAKGPTPAGYLATAAAGAWLAWIFLRRPPRVTFTLTLAPDRLRVASDLPNSIPIDLARDRAGWLIAYESRDGWDSNAVSVFDAEKQELVRLAGGLTRVQVVARRDPWHGADDEADPFDEPRPEGIPVSVLLGAWWPHPAQRMVRAGNMGAGFPWRDPGLPGFLGWERRQHLTWGLMLGGFGLACVAVVLFFGRGTTGERVFCLVAGMPLTLLGARILAWRPKFVAGSGSAGPQTGSAS
jgi:hypothetical protein